MPLSHLGLAVCVVLLWGFNFVVMKHIVTELPPFGATGLRFLLATFPLIFFLPRPAVPVRALVWFGLWFGVIKFALLFTAFRAGMPAGLAALVLQTQVILTIVLVCITQGERPRRTQIIGIALAVSGAAAVIAGQPGSVGMVPVALTFCAAVAWAVANASLKQQGPFDPLSYAVWSSFFPGVVMVLGSIVFEGPTTLRDAIGGLTAWGMAALFYLAYPISIASGAAWAFLLMRHPAATVAPFALLVPVVGFISSWLVYGEQLTVVTLMGGMAILAGLALNVWRPAPIPAVASPSN